MAIDLQILGSKLRRYRDQVEASLDDVSTATGIPQQLLKDYEDARRQPTGDEILILADYYKCDYKFFTSNEQLAAFEQTETLFRKYSAELSRKDRWAILEFLFLCDSEEFLMRNLSSKTEFLSPSERAGHISRPMGLRLRPLYDVTWNTVIKKLEWTYMMIFAPLAFTYSDDI